MIIVDNALKARRGSRASHWTELHIWVAGFSRRGSRTKSWNSVPGKSRGMRLYGNPQWLKKSGSTSVLLFGLTDIVAATRRAN